MKLLNFENLNEISAEKRRKKNISSRDKIAVAIFKLLLVPICIYRYVFYHSWLSYIFIQVKLKIYSAVKLLLITPHSCPFEYKIQLCIYYWYYKFQRRLLDIECNNGSPIKPVTFVIRFPITLYDQFHTMSKG